MGRYKSEIKGEFSFVFTSKTAKLFILSLIAATIMATVSPFQTDAENTYIEDETTFNALYAHLVKVVDTYAPKIAEVN